MLDARVAEVAGRQFNRISREQLRELGMCKASIERRVAMGRLVIVSEGVLAIAPVLEHDRWGRWMGATLTAPDTVLSRASAACAWSILSYEKDLVTVTRPGSGGPRVISGAIVHRSSTLAGETTTLNGIPITIVPRTLLDISCSSSVKTTARALRESIRLERTTLYALGDWLGLVRHRRGAGRLSAAIARYSGLPLEQARSGAEIRAMEILRDAGRPFPGLNKMIAGEEADLSWAPHRLIIEIDGGPFHQDVGEDARKERSWREAGWTVKRLPSDDVYESPQRLLALAPSTNVPQGLA